MSPFEVRGLLFEYVDNDSYEVAEPGAPGWRASVPAKANWSWVVQAGDFAFGKGWSLFAIGL
jgi:hypothetical protein